MHRAAGARRGRAFCERERLRCDRPRVRAGAARAGVVAAFQLVDFEATLLDGAFHERDSSTWAVELAAAVAFREAAARASAQVLEPTMAVEVVTSADHVGDVNGDL